MNGAPDPSALPGTTVDGDVGRHRNLGRALVLISVAQLMVVIDSTIANVALPFIGRDLTVSPANLQWVVTGYALAFGGLLLLGGRLGDLYGRRRMFIVGVTTFALASGLGGLAQSETMLLASRGLQGMGAAIASPAALALISTNFPAGAQRTRAFSVYAGMSGAGAAIGLIFGGWLTGLDLQLIGTHISGWRLTFLINLPIGLTAAWFARSNLTESEAHSGQLDLPGALSGTAGLLLSVYGITRTGDPQHGWANPLTLMLLGAGAAFLAGFLFLERHVENPLLPLTILVHRTRATTFVAMILVFGAIFAFFFFVSQFVQGVMGYTPLQAGFAFLPFSLGSVVGATSASLMTRRVSPRIIACTGILTMAFSLFMFSRLSVDLSAANLLSVGRRGGDLGSSLNYWIDLFPYVLLVSTGMGMTAVSLTLAAVHSVHDRDSGVASGVLNTMQQVGGALGLATLSTIAVTSTHEKVESLNLAVTPLLNHSDPGAITLDDMRETIYWGAFTEGASHVFLAGAIMLCIGAALVLSFLNLKRTDMETPRQPA